MSKYKYRAFVSYSRRDKKFVAWLHKKLENYNISESLRTDKSHLPKKLGTFFKDTEDLAVHSSLDNVLKGVLEESEFLIVVCSLSSSQSHWVNEEIKYFKSIGREDRIIPVIIEGEPNATSNPDFEISYEVYPEALRFEVDAKGKLGENVNNPVGADFRKGKDTKDKALTRIIARILDVDFDDIWQREKKRKFMKKVLLSLIVLVMLSVTTFGVYKWMKEMQFRAINNELSKIVKDSNATKVDVVALEEDISKNLQIQSEINEVEDNVINTRLSVQQQIKMNNRTSQSYLGGRSLIDLKANSINTCRMIVNLNLPSISDVIRETYCKCLFTETIENMKGDKSNLKCEDPIRSSLGLPKSSKLRVEKLEEATQQWNSIDQHIEKEIHKSSNMATDALKNANNVLQETMKNIPGWNPNTHKVSTGLAYVSYCTSMNHAQLPKIEESLIENYCQCLYDETVEVIGELNTDVKLPSIDQMMKDPYSFMREQEKNMKKQEEHGRLFQIESEKHKKKCTEHINHLIPVN